MDQSNAKQTKIQNLILGRESNVIVATTTTD